MDLDVQRLNAVVDIKSLGRALKRIGTQELAPWEMDVSITLKAM